MPPESSDGSFSSTSAIPTSASTSRPRPPPIPPLALCHPGVLPQWERDLLHHAHRVEEGRPLKKHADLPPHLQELLLLQRDDALPFDQDLACIRLQESDNELQEDALAGPAPPQDGQDLACRDRQIQAPEDLVAVEGLVELMKINGTGHHASISSHQKNFVRKKSEIRIRRDVCNNMAVPPVFF